MSINKADIRVLLVDDDPTFGRLLSLTLEALGYSQIKEAVDGQAALELAQTYQPNLVLMDTQMRGLYGYEVCRQMRQEEYGKMAAILGMSNNDNPAFREQWLEAGADGFFPKDNLDGLDGIIQEALKKYQR